MALWEQSQVKLQRREHKALGAESCSDVGFTVKVMGEGEGVQWACRSSHQDLETLHGGTRIRNKLTHCHLGSWPSDFSLWLWLYTNVHVPTCPFVLYKDSTPGTPTILKSGLFVSLDTVAHVCFCFHAHRLVCQFCLLLGNIPFYMCPVIYLINSFLDSLVKYVGSTDCLPGPIPGAAVHSEQESLCPPGANVPIRDRKQTRHCV